ncbi:MAG: sensor histidine kinase [Thermoproteota archaeon]|nr:sensor histidine kinase [Thermoproteota archaeon]
MLGTAFSKNNIILLLVIAIVGIGLSIISYQYSTITASEIAEIAAQDVKSNVNIQVYELARILVRSIESISVNLRTLSSAILFSENGNAGSYNLMNAAQRGTSELTEGYYWIDGDGKLLATSDDNNLGTNTIGENLSNKEYFSVPKMTNKPYFGTAVEAKNNFSHLYISFPIITTYNGSNDITNRNNRESDFKGVVVAAISLGDLGRFLQKELSPNFESTLGLIDRNGVILYSRNEAVVGRNYLAPEFQSLIPAEIKDSYNKILENGLQGKSGSQDLLLRGNVTTLAYQPVVLDGRHIWTLYLSAPHNLASNVGFIINQQKNFSTIVVIVIGSLAFGIAFLILSWNKRLEGAVTSRTLELKKANESLTESNMLLASANKQLEIHDRMQKEFINVAAHELRTPIMPILGEAELIEDKFSGNKSSAEVDKDQITVIIRNAKRLDRLAADILDVTRIEGKSLQLNKERFKIDEILSQIVKETRRLIENDPMRNEKVDIEYESVNIEVNADKSRITQVISNLVSNAIKFTNEGTISISCKIEEKEILLLVRDSGRGIDPEIHSRLFSKFASKSEQGTGLGLFISRSIVESHGGRIWAYNNDSSTGATFVFTLPI